MLDEPSSTSVRDMVSCGVIALLNQMNTTGTVISSTHSTGFRRKSRTPSRRPAVNWSHPVPARIRLRATRVVPVSTTPATASAPTVHTNAQPRSPSRPPCRDGRSTIHSVTKWVGSQRVAARSGDPRPGPKNTSMIQMNRISTVPLTGLRTSTPTTAPMAR